MSSTAPRFVQKVTILGVRDLAAEIEFYEKLGWEVVFAEKEPPYFVCLGFAGLSFGLEVHEGLDIDAANAAVSWGFTTEDLRPLIELARAEGWPVEGPLCYWPENDRWKLWIPTPAGYRLGLEGPNPELRERE